MMFSKKMLAKSLILALATGIYVSDIAEAGQNVVISTNVSGSVYGNGSGDNNTYMDSSADTNSNTVTIEEGANISGDVFGTDSNNTVNENNTVIVNGGNIHGMVTAAHGENSKSNNNTVIINEGTIGGYVHAAYDGADETNNNTLTINGGVFDASVYTACGNSSNNNVITINNGLIKYNVYGAGWYSDNASNNRLVINGGTIQGDVYVSYHTPIVNNNTVDWYGGNIDGEILGSNYSSSEERVNTSFNFYASSANSNKIISGLGNFKNYNFYIDNTVLPGSTLIKVNNTVDLRNSNIGVAMTSNAALNIGDNVRLLDTRGLKTNANLVNDPSHMEGYNTGVGRARGQNIYDVYDFTLTNDGYNLQATVGNVSPNPQSDIIPGSRQPEVAVLDDKLDIVDYAYQMSVNRTEPVIYMDINHMDIKKDNWNLRGNDMVIGQAYTRKGEDQKNTITQGPFFEHGDNSYSGVNFYNTGNVNGSGKVKKYGAGYLFRQVKSGRHHFDAYVRAGKVTNDFRSNMASIGNVDYDNSDMYYAAHLGYGQFLNIDPHTKMDIYGKYFYKIVPGSNTTTHVNNFESLDTEFDTMSSHKFRVGSKLTWDYMKEKKLTMYADLAIEHELSHEQTTNLGGRTLSNSSGVDTTGVLELGLRQVFGPKDAFLFTIDLQGYVGTRKGIGGNIGVRFNF